MTVNNIPLRTCFGACIKNVAQVVTCLRWTEDALKEMEKVPAFVRGMARKPEILQVARDNSWLSVLG